MGRHFLLLISGFCITAFISYKAGLLNPSPIYLYGNNHNNNNNKTHIQISKLESYLNDIRIEVKSMKQDMKQLKSWEKMDEYRTHVWKSLGVDTPPKADLRNPRIMLNHVKMNCTAKYDLIILISSYAKHFNRRQNIRTTWGNSSQWKTRKLWKLVFVLGTVPDKNTLVAIKKESKLHKDIILEDIPESFYQLSKKVMVGLQWAFISAQFHFILKADDDVFVHVDRMMLKLDGPLKRRHYVGSVMRDQPVERKGRYGLTLDEHPRERFHSYCSGGGFILSQHAISKILPRFNWRTPLKIDDAYVGQLVFEAGFKVHNEDGFYMWNTWCEYTDHLLVSHPAKDMKCVDFLLKRCLIENGSIKDTHNLTSVIYGMPPNK